MKKQQLFKEEQHFQSYPLMAVVALLMLAVLARLVVFGAESGLLINSLLLATLAGLGAGLYIMFQVRIKTTISDKNIAYKVKPLHTRKQKIRLDEVTHCAIVQSPKYSDWFGSSVSFGREHFYSFNGRNGLAVTTRDGEQYFFGSDHLPELERAIRRVIQ